ncbi:MAG: YihA family ribosome biogenesis GTP-binding protein [Parvularculaceae bacterium]|nr:YihA family ribosome biogenesis GTP-binding protein [Parvularculaceae bacterium]
MSEAAPSAEAVERGRLLFCGPAEFMRGVVSIADLPEPGPSEIAFAGRSNVGKSSLLNALTGRKDLARASTTPGRTQEINFFNLGNRLRLVDLPGFGYARAARADARRWTQLTKEYLKGRPSLKRVCLLVDSRHGLKDVDADVMTLLDKAGVAYQIVLTKADKLKPTEMEKAAAAAAAAVKRRPAAHPVILHTSAETGDGIAELRAELAMIA